MHSRRPNCILSIFLETTGRKPCEFNTAGHVLPPGLVVDELAPGETPRAFAGLEPKEEDN
jgi:hypothetical protein